MRATGLTNEMIRNNSIYDVIPMYLLDGETKESILKKFNNNVVDAIIFLRKRASSSIQHYAVISQPSDIFSEKQNPPAILPNSKNAPVKKKRNTPAKESQKKLW